MNLLLPDLGLLFWMVIAFGTVFLILAKFGFPAITKMVDERKLYIDKSLEAAHQANNALTEIKATSEKLLAEAQQQQVKILTEANAAREKIIAQAREEAQEQARKDIEQAREQIRAERDEAIREVRREIASLSVAIAEKITRKELSREDSQIDMINRLLDEVEPPK